jgi:hypothetical protein
MRGKSFVSQSAPWAVIDDAWTSRQHGAGAGSPARAASQREVTPVSRPHRAWSSTPTTSPRASPPLAMIGAPPLRALPVSSSWTPHGAPYPEIVMRLGLAASLSGRRSAKSPSRYVACTFSVPTWTGNRKVRWKGP